jgi:crotonobetainyl-CoA:carnitine CoA-transferase CaiB-like acyl-CoA transferase
MRPHAPSAVSGKAHVFVTNVPHAQLVRAGLDYATLKHDLPDLIYASASAWGRYYSS